MANTRETISAYEARVHWGRVLDDVRGGKRYVVSKRGEPVAALVPLDAVSTLGTEADEAAELAVLVAQLEAQTKRNNASIDRAFAEIDETRRVFEQWRAEREQHAKGPRHGVA